MNAKKNKQNVIFDLKAINVICSPQYITTSDYKIH